jgi:predicted phage terminase large subunit-like protein
MQARSDTERQAALDWFDNTVSTRTGRMPAFVLIMQRLHVSDLTGHLLKKGGWHHVRWPMRYEKCSCATAPNCDPDGERRCALHQTDPTWRADPLDPRTVAGELLHPTFKTEEDVKRLELDLGPLDAPGQLQQRPVAEGGGLFKRAWFKIIDQLPGHAIKQSCRGWDTAATQGGGDYTVGVKTTRFFGWEVKDGRREFKSYPEFYIEDVMRDQLSPANVDTVMLAIARQDGKAVVIREEREGGGSGKAVTNSHANMLAGFAYDEMLLGSDKVTRSKPLRTQVEAGNVYLLRGPWNEAFISELCAFNAGDHDDQVDGASCSFNGLLEMPTPKPRSVTLMP